MEPIDENRIDVDGTGAFVDVECGVRRGGALCELPRCDNGVRDGVFVERDGELGCRPTCVPTECPHPAATTVRLVEWRCLVRLNDTYVTGLDMDNALAAYTSRVGAGATLVIPTSGSFNQAVRSLGRKHTRIDIGDRATDTTFVTSTGAVPTFTAFGTNQPLNVVGAADCVVARSTSAQWLAEPCTRLRGVICEIAP